MSDFARLVKQQRGIAVKAAPTKPLPSPPRQKAKTSPKQVRPPPLPVAPVAIRNGQNYIVLRERFDAAADEAFACMRKCRAFDALLVILWVGMLVFPPMAYSARAHDAVVYSFQKH